MTNKMKALMVLVLMGFMATEVHAQRRDRGYDDRYDRGRHSRPDRGERRSARMARQLVMSTQNLQYQVQREAYPRQRRVKRVARNLVQQSRQLARVIRHNDDQSRYVRQSMNQFIQELNFAQGVFRQARMSWHVDNMLRRVKQDARQLRREMMRGDRRGRYDRDRRGRRGRGGRGLSDVEKGALIVGGIIGLIDIID